MLVTFRSKATESITMFGDVAQPLLKLMGASGVIPGALNAEDVPAALSRLEREVDALKTQAATREAPAADKEGAKADEAATGEPAVPVPLYSRAIPLMDLLKRAAAARVAVTWETP